MSRYTPTNVSSISGLNAELTKIASIIDTLLDREGTIPNQLEADLDVNSNDILNVSTINTDNLVLRGEIAAIDFTSTILSVKDFGAVGDGITDDIVAINAAIDFIDTSGGKGGTVTIPTGVYLISSSIINKTNVEIVGAGKRSTLINYSGDADVYTSDSLSESGLRNVRISLGISPTAVGLNLTTTTASALYNKYSDIEIASSSIAGQIGINAVASDGFILSENWFHDILIFGLDKPIVKTGIEGNFWRGIAITTYGTGASPIGINDTSSHAEFMQARIAGVGAGVTSPIGYSTSCDYSIIDLSVDIGATPAVAVSSTIGRNTWTITRAENLTPIGTFAALDIVIDPQQVNVNNITFPATQIPSADANTLDDYEEGTWTPVDASGAALTFTSESGTYTKIGNLVIAPFSLTFPATADASAATIGGLPFTAVGSGSPGSVNFSLLQFTTPITGLVTASSTNFKMFTLAAAAVTNADHSGFIVRGTVIYQV